MLCYAGTLHRILLRAEIPIAILVAAVLLLTAVPGGSAVLCVGPDGHAAIEDEGSLCCKGPARTPAAPPALAAMGSGDPCAGCTDYRLTSSADAQKAGPAQPVRAAAAVGDLPMLRCERPDVQPAAYGDAPHGRPSPGSQGPITLRC